MTLTTLDSKTALIVVDLQKGIVRLPTAHPAGDVVERANELADAFRSHGLPVVLVTVAGGAPGRTEQPPRAGGQPAADWADLAPKLNQHASDHKVLKTTWGAFPTTDLDNYLKKAGVTQVVVLGIATSIGVESTARQAYENGYNVTLAVDAMTDMSLDAHTYTVTHVFPRLGESGTTAEIIDLLAATRS